MFRLLFLFLSIIIFAQKPINFNINGTIKGYNNKSIYFSYEGIGKNRKWDSTKVKNNKFFFEGFISESKNGFITVLKKNRVSELSDPNVTERLFIDPASKISIDFTAKNFHKAKIFGSESQREYSVFTSLTKSAGENYNNILKRYVLERYNSYVALYLLKENKEVFSYEEISHFFSKLNINDQKSEYGIFISEYIDKLKESMPKQNAVNFSDTDLNGKKIQLKDFKGNYVLLDFWASWCKPCRERNPELLEFFQKYNNLGFSIIAIADDVGNDGTWRKAILKDKTEIFTQLNNDTIAKQYSVPFIPTQILIDRNGIIVHRYDDINEVFENLKSDLKLIFSK